ncbi:serine/threonine-protein kinase PknK [Polyangium aurulentum]|uniref:serine/threonine-protein kinase n=1 Tax=Polyangium aurulentum TaxID=2567896 RepID=UPI001469AE77|nr:serine/threonine-protein kinase [Polyangium aurulentum]UQA55960.1 protein kinase [Polyangium aurulentum]
MESARPPLPASIGAYRVTGILGSGGMGVVYRAEHESTGAPVALKTVRVPSKIQVSSIRREILALGRLRHPGIARIVDEGVYEGLPWYAMELLEGHTLRSHLVRVFERTGGGLQSTVRTVRISRTLPEPEEGPRSVIGMPAVFSLRRVSHLLAIVRGLCAPLAYLHGEGLVHRDLKPDNVLVRPNGQPVLVDFGIAASFSGARGREELGAGERALGSVRYMSPEQINGGLVDARADLYALGCVLYECLTGRTPFTGTMEGAILYRHLHQPPRPPSAHVAGVPPELEQLALKLLEKRPEERIGHATDVAEALAVLGIKAVEPEGAPPPRAYLYRPALAGRTEVVQELATAIDRAAAGVGSLVFLGGESGVGKTRIAMEMALLAETRGMHVMSGQCAIIGGAGEGGAAAAPLHPFRQILLAVADRCRERGAAEVERLLGAGGKVLSFFEPTLGELPIVRDAPDPPALPPDAARRRVFDALAHTLGALAMEKPLLLLLDDLQWGDELSLGFLREIGARDPVPGLFVLGTYRMEEMSPALGQVVHASRAQNVAVGRLDRASVRAMVAGMLALGEPPMNLVGFLAERSDGNPFFVAEYLRAAIAEGLLGRDHVGRWQLRGESGDDEDRVPASLTLPGTLAELIERRLGKLGDVDRALVDRAAVLGREFDAALLGATAALEEHVLLQALEELRVRQVIEEHKPGRMRFVHDKLREIALTNISPERRVELHRDAALALEARAADLPDAFPDLGHHFAEAGLLDRASLYFGRAADRARAAWANVEAIGFYRAALRALSGAGSSPHAPPPARLYEGLGDVLALSGRQEEARGAFEDALAHVAEPQRLMRARLHRKIGKTWEWHHKHAEAIAAYTAAEHALGPAVPPGESSEAFWDEWLQIRLDQIAVHYWVDEAVGVDILLRRVRPIMAWDGNRRRRAHVLRAILELNVRLERYLASAETVQYARSYLQATRALGNPVEAATARFVLAGFLLFHGALEEAAREMAGALEEAERLGYLAMQARCLAYSTLIQRRRRSIEGTRRFAERTLAIAEAARIREYVGTARANLGWVAFCEGRNDECVRECHAAFALWEATGAVYQFQWTARLPLAAVALSRGNVSEAAKHASLCFGSAQQRLPAPLADALTEALTGEELSAEDLKRALDLALELGYL